MRKRQVLVEDFFYVDKRDFSEDHAVEKAAKSPNSSTERVVAASDEELRRHEDIRPFVLVNLSVGSHEAGNSEVDKLDVVCRPVDQDVVGLDVSLCTSV